MDISGPSPRIFAQPNNMSQPGCRTVGEMEASKISEIVLLYWRCVINLWFSCRFRTVCTRAYRTFGIMWVGCESNSNPLFQGMGPVLRDVFLWVLNEKPCRCAVAPAEAPPQTVLNTAAQLLFLNNLILQVTKGSTLRKYTAWHMHGTHPINASFPAMLLLENLQRPHTAYK